ncbi:CD209 antigen-like protein E isoform X2 [Cyprinodon tularosa]|uniref:CD209 antigen-like protein E isoform X2 n=1 Tax=Cyprinodon tularosa TaxID=77115 RepID=UPI0018E20D85|nr:CD209 antigen-like protein E isoform X2 [Cyprinodon tularosa]
MARLVNRELAEVNMDYVNLQESSVRMHTNGRNLALPDPRRRLFTLVGVGFGLLCIVQAALNVSLRLTLSAVRRNDTDQQRFLTGKYIKQGWVYFHTSFYFISSTKKSWQESRKFCQEQSADLVIINTEEEQDFTRQFHRLTWIGVHNVSRTGQWTWVDGTPLTKSYWGPGEPNGYEGRNENCVEIRFFDRQNSWNDIPCEDQNFWICEKEAAL